MNILFINSIAVGEIMYCLKCGKQITSEAIYCPYCGASQTTTSIGALPSTKISRSPNPAIPTCEYESCTNLSAQKCSTCGRIFCVKHIAFMDSQGNLYTPSGWKCKSCAKAFMEDTKKREKFWGRLTLISLGLLGLGALFSSNEPALIFIVPAVLGIGIGLPIWLVHFELSSRRKKFFHNNFSN